MRAKVNLSFDPDVVSEARALGLNMSRLAEDAVVRAVKVERNREMGRGEPRGARHLFPGGRARTDCLWRTTGSSDVVAQFEVFKVGDTLVVDIQTDLIGLYVTRVVAPLREKGSYASFPRSDAGGGFRRPPLDRPRSGTRIGRGARSRSDDRSDRRGAGRHPEGRRHPDPGLLSSPKVRIGIRLFGVTASQRRRVTRIAKSLPSLRIQTEIKCLPKWPRVASPFCPRLSLQAGTGAFMLRW